MFVQTGLGDYLRNDLDPARITAELKRARPLPAGHFNQSEIALYDRALDEAVRYVVEVAAKLPAFDAAAVAESLQRLRHMQDSIDKVLDTVQRIERAVVKATDPFSRFEADYRQAVIRNLDYVELFGVDLSEEAIAGAGQRRSRQEYPVAVGRDRSGEGRIRRRRAPTST